MRTAEVERDRDSETKWWELEVVVFGCAQNLVVCSVSSRSEKCLRIAGAHGSTGRREPPPAS